MRTHYGNLNFKAACIALALSLPSMSFADDYIPAIFIGGYASEDSAMQVAIIKESSIKIIYEDGPSSICIPRKITHLRPGLFRSAHGVEVECAGADMWRLNSHNMAGRTHLKPKDVQWAVYLTEVERGFEIEVRSCLSPTLDDEICPVISMYKAN